MPKLPTLVYDPRTRVGGEAFLYYNLGEAFKSGSIGVTDPDEFNFLVEQACAGSNDNPPASAVWVLRAKTPIKSLVDIDVTVQGKTATMPALAPMGHSVEFSADLTDPVAEGDISLTGGVAGDSMDIFALPNPASDILICFGQGLNAEVGEENRPIPRGFIPVDHYVRQRPTNTLTIAEFYQSNREGLSVLRNRDATLIQRMYPDGGATPSEIKYFTRVRLAVPTEIPQDANESVQVNATGSFGEFLAFMPIQFSIMLTL